MAIFSKKLRIKNTSGSTQVVNIYSTTGESGSNYMRTTVDGQAGYVTLGSTSDANRTNGRVKKTNGVTYAILVSSVPAYGYNYITWNGSFTVPSGVTKLRVTCVGGGAGGIIWRDYEHGTGTITTNGQNGGNTVFGSVVASGAIAAMWKYTRTVTGSGEYEHYDTTTIQKSGSTGSQNMGVYGGTSSYPGAGAVALTNYAGTAIGYAGAGGYADGDHHPFIGPGASGYKVVTTVGVSPGQVIGYSVGGGGLFSWSGGLGNGGNSGGNGGAPGSAGAILVEWGKGIQ